MHTPTPWTLDTSGSTVLISRGKEKAIAYGSGEVTQVFQTGMTREEVLANARLMVSAPELLEELVSCLAYVQRYYRTLPDDGAEQDFIMSSVIEPARKAIAKAKGETNED